MNDDDRHPVAGARRTQNVQELTSADNEEKVIIA